MSDLWNAFRGRVAQWVAPAPKEIVEVAFESPIGYGPGGKKTVLNPVFFAAEETAQKMMERFGAAEVREFMAPGSEGPLYTASHLQRYLYWPDGKGLLYINRKPAPGYAINAGFLAGFYQRNPAAIADGLAKKALETDRAHCKAEPLWLTAPEPKKE